MIKYEIRKLQIHEDERGWLAEILRNEHAKGEIKGQFYVTVAKPGISKGNHYHKRKTEWFCVINGMGKLTLKNITSGELEEIDIGENNMIVVKIPPNVAHSIKNIGKKDMMLLAYITEPFDQKDPDTFPFEF